MNPGRGPSRNVVIANTREARMRARLERQSLAKQPNGNLLLLSRTRAFG
jgi:hypothetical protein